MHLHWIDPVLKCVDDWHIERKNELYVVKFLYPQVHQAWLHEFDRNRRQYEWYCVAATCREAEIIARWLRHRRMLRPKETPVKPTDHLKLSDHQLLYISLKKSGLTYKQIAEDTHCSEDNIKQFFSRKARSLGLKGATTLIEHLRITEKI